MVVWSTFNQENYTWMKKARGRPKKCQKRMNTLSKSTLKTGWPRSRGGELGNRWHEQQNF